MENLNLFYQDIGPSSSAGCHLTQEDAAKEALAIRISQRYAQLEEERLVIETMVYHDKYKKILDEIWKDKVELDGKTIKEDEEAVKGLKFGREDMKKIDRGITMINHTQTEAMGKLSNVLCQVGVTTIIAKFLILDIPIDRDAPIVVGRGFLYTMAARFDVLRIAESDNDDKEEYVIKRNRFGAPICGPKPAPYLKCTNPEDRSAAIQTVTNPFRKISVWKKAVRFLGSLPVSLKQVNWKPDHNGCYTNEEEATGLQEHTTEKLDRHDPNTQDNTNQWKMYCFHKFIMSSCYGKDDVLNQMGCDGEIDDLLRIRVHEAESDEEIFTSVAWIRAFIINEPIYAELCHEFYSTYEFDEVCADDELQSKKIIKFRLGRRAHSLTLLEFAQRLGLYQAVELEEDGFNVYFEGSLRNDDNFNARDYWLSISREDNLGLSSSHTFNIRNPILRVIHKIITYGLCQRTTGYDKVQKNDLWLLSMFDARHQNGYANVAWVITRWMKRKGAGTQKESQICCGRFISKLARKCKVLKKDVARSLSALIYSRDLAIAITLDMDQDSAHMVAALKVPMLKPENGNAPPITKVVKGVETIIAPTTAEEKI
ncbi:hypothetical protein Tco_0885144 [Tanacetum coccineum]